MIIPMDVMPAGIVMLLRLVQKSNAKEPNEQE